MSKPVTFYCHPTCTTCAKARSWLSQKGIPFSEIDLTKTAPTTQELADILARGGLEDKKLLNTSGREYRSLGKEAFAAMSREELLSALSANGMLIKRPVLTDGEKALVGFKEEAYQKFFNL